MRPRLHDVATLARVSPATVSRVLNDRPGVAEATRHRVREAVVELGYAPPSTARLTRAGVVGLIVPELDNPVFPLFAQEIETALSEVGVTTVLCTASVGGVHESAYVDMLRSRGVAGFVFVSGLHADTSADHSVYFHLVAERVPLVLVNGYVEGLAAAFVSADEAAGTELAVDHLAELGHTRIGCATGPRHLRPAARRYAGYLRAMRGAFGDDAPTLVVDGHYSVDGGGEAMRALLERGATAVITGSDLMAIGAIRAAHDAGLTVPDDVSVIGYDDTTLVQYMAPPLTTLRQPVRDMGRAAARLLLDEIAGRRVPTTEHLFRPSLVARRSTGPVLSTKE